MANWTREQTIIALGVYCKVPFNRASNTNPEIVAASKLIGRSPAAVKMKVGNFGSFDPALQAKGIVGLANSSKLDEEVWNEYSKDWERLAYDCERLKIWFESQKNTAATPEQNISIPEGKEREAMVRQRINQSFFRSAVLTSYNYRCCITGLSKTGLLEACHIVGWSTDIINRLNPSNGICLNVLFHKAYDCNYIGITPDYKVVISDKLFDEHATLTSVYHFFTQYDGTSINMPDRFFPNKDLLAKHYQQFLNQ